MKILALVLVLAIAILGAMFSMKKIVVNSPDRDEQIRRATNGGMVSGNVKPTFNDNIK